MRTFTVIVLVLLFCAFLSMQTVSAADPTPRPTPIVEARPTPTPVIVIPIMPCAAGWHDGDVWGPGPLDVIDCIEPVKKPAKPAPVKLPETDTL